MVSADLLETAAKRSKMCIRVAAVRRIRLPSRLSTHDGYPRSEHAASMFYSVQLSLIAGAELVCVTQLGGYH
jgi:hypothetical protein